MLSYSRLVVRVEEAHPFAAPVERGFAFITDTANWPRFWPGFVRLEPQSTWGAVGDTAVLVTRLLGRERKLSMTVTDFERDRLVEVPKHAAGPTGRTTRTSFRARRRRVRLPARGRVRAPRRPCRTTRPAPAAARDQTRLSQHVLCSRARARRTLAEPGGRSLDGSEGGRLAAGHGHPPPRRYTPAGTPASASVTAAQLVTVETFCSA